MITCHLLGARGSVGTILAEALEGRPGLHLVPWSGAEGLRSYDAFLDQWRECPEPGSVVLFAGGRSRGSTAELSTGHIARAAALVDCFLDSNFPRAVLHLGSAAELVETSLYGTIKLAQRRLLETGCHHGRTPFLSLRLHSMVPTRRPDRGLFGELLTQYEAAGDAPVSVHHLGGARDYLSDVQLAHAVRTLVAEPEAWANTTGAVELGNGEPVRVDDWLGAFAVVFGARRVEERFPGFPDPEILADPAPLRELLENCSSGAAATYDFGHPDLVQVIRGWQAQAP